MMQHTRTLPQLFSAVLLSLFSIACASDAASPIARLEQTVRAATADSTAWELLEFAATPKVLENMFLSPSGTAEANKLWVFAVFVNTSQTNFRRSRDLVRYMLIPATADLHDAIHTKRIARTRHSLSARVVVADLDAARAYFAPYPFSHVFGDFTSDVFPPRGRDAMLAAVQRMMRDGLPSPPRHRADPAEPVALFLRPGAAAQFRKGRAGGGVTGAIAELRAHTLFIRDALARALVADYGDTARGVAGGAGKEEEKKKKKKRAKAEERRHFERMAEAVRTIRARREMYYSNPYDMEAVRGMTPEKRVETLMTRIRARDDAGRTKEEGEGEDRDGEEEGKTGKREAEKERAVRDSAQFSSTNSLSSEESLLSAHDDL